MYLPASPPAAASLHAQGGDSAEEAAGFFRELGQFFSELWVFVGANFWTLVIWAVIIGFFGGWNLLGAIIARMWYALPFNRRKAIERAELKRQLKERNEQRKRALEERNRQLDAAHAEDCACGERCDGREACEQHHPECNCDHMGSFCVCQDEDECDCECRCDCKECDGYFKEEPLRRVPHTAAAARPPAKAAPRRAADTHPRTKVADTAEPSPPPSWATSRERFLALSEEYANYECDVYELLRLPALADVTFDTTATFIEAFMKANQLLTPEQPKDMREAQQFVDAVEKACNAWKLAVQAAEIVGDKRLDEAEQTLLRRANSSLRLADNTDKADERVHAQERAGAFVSQLALKTAKSGRWRLPAPARAQIEAWSRPELTAGESATTTD